MKLHLVVLTAGKTEGKVIPITLSQFLIGRDPQCHLRPASAVISKRHCALLMRGDKVFIRDFDSTNGTFVNNRQIKGEIELQNEDRLKIGPLDFGVRIEAGVPVDKQTPVPPTKAPAVPTSPTAAPATAAAGPKTPPPPTKTPPPPTKTPPPPTKAPPVPAKPPAPASEDDDVAAMLLSLDDGSTPNTSISPDSIPEGSTVMDLPSPLNPEKGDGNEGADKKAPAKPAHESTSSAAKAILEKYMRRPRT